MRITFFGTYNETNHPRVRVLREGLTALGHHVDVVNVPLRLDTAGRVQLARQPWRAPLIALRLLSTWVSLLLRSRKVHRPDVVLVGYLGHFDVHLARCRWPRTHIAVDHMVSLADTVRDRGLDSRKLVVKVFDLIDRAAIRQADTVVVDTAEQLDSLGPKYQAKAVIVPVGAPQAWLDVGAARQADPTASSLRVVFFGLYTPLQGAPTIGEAIHRLAEHDITWTMIGLGQDRAATEAAAGTAAATVTWLDWVDGADLPAVVADHDVCLGIFGTGPKALRVTPNKVYQGAAAACAIVTSDTVPQRLSLGDAALYVKPGDADALVDALARLAADPALLRRQQQEARSVAEARFAPAVVVDGLATRLAAAHHK